MEQTDLAIRSWNNLVSHPLQSWEWGEFRQSMGVDLVRLDKGWQMTFHRIPHTPFTIGYFPKGPKPTQEMLETLTKLGKEKNALFIQLEPNVKKLPDHNAKLTPNLYPSHHPLFTTYTFILDLTKSEEELLAAMHPKTRYNIKVAERHGVGVQEDNSAEAFEAYIQLTRSTTERQGFYAHNEAYHRQMWNIMHASGIASLWTATYQGTTLAAWILFRFGDTLYYPYGASSVEHRNVMAPNLLCWEIIKWAKSQNLRSFDLWGAIGPNPSPNDPWFGFHRFKAGFGPELVEFVGSFDLVTSPVLYPIYKLADTLRWTLLKLRR